MLDVKAKMPVTSAVVVPYEVQRAARIRRNEERLKELDVRALPPAGYGERGTREPRQRPQKGEIAPSRRSGRLRGERAEIAGLEAGPDELGQAPARPARARQPKIEDPDALDAHNLWRVRTMSDVALRRRIGKIRRRDKMESFVKVLDACGMDELVVLAREALEEL